MHKEEQIFTPVWLTPYLGGLSSSLFGLELVSPLPRSTKPCLNDHSVENLHILLYLCSGTAPEESLFLPWGHSCHQEWKMWLFGILDAKSVSKIFIWKALKNNFFCCGSLMYTWCLKEVQAKKNSPTVESGFLGRYWWVHSSPKISKVGHWGILKKWHFCVFFTHMA